MSLYKTRTRLGPALSLGLSRAASARARSRAAEPLAARFALLPVCDFADGVTQEQLDGSISVEVRGTTTVVSNTRVCPAYSSDP